MRNLVQLLRDAGAPDALITLAERLTAAESPEVTAESSAEDRLLSFPTDVDPLTDDELTELVNGLREVATADGSSIDLIHSAADAIDVVTGEQGNRDQAAEDLHAERDAALARLNPTASDNTDGEDTDDGGDGIGDDGDTTTDDTEATTDEPAADDTGDEVTDDVVDDDREPVLASGRRVSRADLLAARPRRTRNRGAVNAPPAPVLDVMSPIVWASDVPDERGGEAAANLALVDRAMERKATTFRGSRASRNGVVEYLRVASVQGQFPEERRLVDVDGNALAPVEQSRRIEAALTAGIDAHMNQGGGLVAAGGICALPTPIYNVVTMGDTRRPIRDQALVSFQTARGGVTDLAPPTLPSILTGDTNAAISQWTETDDSNATAGTPTKPCQRIVCGSQRTTKIYAVTHCLTVGNMLSRTFPELQTAWSSLAMVAQARFAEALMFARLQTLSTATTNLTTDWSASRDVLAILDQTAAGMRSRHRLSPEFPFIVILPETLLPVLRIDISRALPGGSFQENLTLAQAQINAWFAARNITPVWSPDVNVIGAQGATALAALPPTINYVMYPAGTFIHLDAGELDLGVVRDTVTNATNDFQIWGETFENIHMVGPESIAGAIDVCPSGAVSGTIDPAPFCASYT